MTSLPGINMAGTYPVRDEPSGHPFTLLRTDGTGVFEMFGAPDPEDVYQIRWCILSDAAGKPVVARETSVGVQYTMLLQYVDKPWQGLTYDAVSYIVQTAATGKLYINGDRVKDK